MIPSSYTITVSDFPAPGKHLLYNTRSQAQVVIDDELRSAIDALPAEPGNAQTAATFQQLARMGFIVSSKEEDRSALERSFARIRADDTVLRPTILTTYACNFACTYCVEEGVKQPMVMDEKTSIDAAAYIIRKLDQFGSKRISLTYYGGEPLLNMPAIRTSASILQDAALARGIAFGFMLSTNGALLTPDVVGELKPLGLVGAKITLDGPREAHDHNRPFRNGKGSFDLLLKNIETTADQLDIIVEVNVDARNAPRIPELLDLLAERGLRQKIRQVLFSPISPTPKDREGLRPSAEVPCAIASTDSSRQIMALTSIAVSKGFKVPLGVAAHVCEMVSKRSGFIIDPLGHLSRCGGLAGRTEFGFGNIYGEENDPYLGSDLWRRCADCAYAPICGDGCPFGSYIRFGDPLRFNCAKEATEYLVKESLKLAYVQKSRKPAQ